MTADRDFRRQFFQALADEPLEANDPRYQPRVGPDPIRSIRETISFSAGQSVQLLAGHPGAGKSTELARLGHQLHVDGFWGTTVWPERMGPFLSHPVQAGGIAYMLRMLVELRLTEDKHFTGKEIRSNLSPRIEAHLRNFLGIRSMEEVLADPHGARRLRTEIAEAGSHFSSEIKDFFKKTFAALRQKHGLTGFFLLVDGLDHFGGTPEADAALIRTFVDEASQLQLPEVHLVFTVPAWLPLARPEINRLYAGVHTLSAWPVRHPYEGAAEGAPDRAGIDALIALVERRGDVRRLLGSPAQVESLILATGGHLRDLLRALRTLCVEAHSIPADEGARTAALEAIRAQYPLAAADLAWLAEVARSRQVGLAPADVVDRARLFDGAVLGYRNGRAWHDVHPLLRSQVLAAPRVSDAPAAAVTPGPAPGLVRLETLEVERYRSVVHARLALGPVTVLVGPNGAGKSSILDGLRLLHDHLTSGLERAAADRSQALGMLHDHAELAEVHIAVSAGGVPYAIRPAFVGGRIDPLLLQSLGDAPPVRRRSPLLGPEGLGGPLHHLLSAVRFHHGRAFDLAYLRSRGSPLGYDTTLQQRGENLWSVLRNLHDRRATDPRYDRIIEAMGEAFPQDFRGLHVEQTGQSVVDGRFRLEHRRDLVPAIGVADGHLQMLLLLTALLGASEDEPALWILDEPEISLHPHAVAVFARALREATAAAGHQAIVATQSPVLLSQFEPSESYVVELVEGATRARRLTDIVGIEDLLADYATGSLYMAELLGRQSRDADAIEPTTSAEPREP